MLQISVFAKFVQFNVVVLKEAATHCFDLVVTIVMPIEKKSG